MLRMTLGFALRRALDRQLPSGWLYLPESLTLTAETPCVLALDDEEFDDQARPVAAVRAGFVREGLDTATMEDTGACARSFQDPPTDNLLIESFEYYLQFDAFLPTPGAPAPPPWEETQRRLDREFYDLLGPERTTQGCDRDGCLRGAVSHSRLCKVHHFESIHRRRCPFDD